MISFYPNLCGDYRPFGEPLISLSLNSRHKKR
jgi:hypothetical protein